MGKRVLSYLKFLENVVNNNTPKTFESILSKYVSDINEFSDYNSKFIITKLLENLLTKNGDKRLLNLDILEEFAPKLFTSDGINKIRDYKNSDWIKSINEKLSDKCINYPNLVSQVLRDKQIISYDSSNKYGMITTNIKIFKIVVGKLNALLPDDIRFNFIFKGLTEITDKNFLKLLSFYKDKIFTDKNIEEFKKVIDSTSSYSDIIESKFIQYLKQNGLESKKASLKDDFKGIDVIDQNNITYQVKAPKNVKISQNGYFVPSTNQLDIKKLLNVDKLALYVDNTFKVIDTKNIKLDQDQNGLMITVSNS